MRTVRYSVAMSLDGFIAGPAGEVDWLPTEVDLDWNAFMARFDTVVMGRATWEFASVHGGGPAVERTFVCSRTLDPVDVEGVEVTSDARATVHALREEESDREIWLMGGGALFASLLEADLVDAVEVAMVPVLLGKGIPFLPEASHATELTLAEVRELGGGVVLFDYRVDRDRPGEGPVRER